MATREELEQALRAAHKAGDTVSAQKLAAALSAKPQPNVDKIRSEFEQMPWYQKAGTALDDTLRLAANGATLDARDKFAYLLGGDDAETERAKTEAARIRAGSAAPVAEVGGAMAPAMLLPNVSGAMAAQFTNPILKWMAGMTGAGLEGSALGGVQALNRDEPVIDGQVSGGIGGIAGKAIGDLASAGINKAGEFFSPNPARLNSAQLRSAKDRAYQEVTDEGVEYTPGTIRGLLAEMDNATPSTYAGRHDAVIANKGFIQHRLDDGAPKTLTDVDMNRQIIKRDLVNIPNDSAQSDMGLDMTKAMDDYLDQVGPLGVTARSGDPEAGLDAMNRGRSLNSRFRKLEDLELTEDRAARKAARSLNSGEDSTLRERIDSILNTPKKLRGYTPDEKEAMHEIVVGTRGQQALRQAGRMTPGGGLSFGAAGAAATIGGILSGGSPTVSALMAGAPSVAGYVSKKLSEKSTKKSVQDFMDLVSSGGNKANLRRTPILDENSEKVLRRLFMMDQIRD